jgi:DNA-binding NtrC family response regulator
MEKFKTQSLKEATRRFEKEYIAQTLRRFGGSKEETAEALGLSVATLYRKIGS